MFGASNNTANPFLFGSKPATGAPAASPFGASSSTGGLFGQKPASTTNLNSGANSGGLFGNQNAAKPAAPGGLFGSAPALQNNASGGLFGSNNAGTQASGGLFGNTNNNTQNNTQNNATAGGLFGSNNANTTNTNPAGGGGLFGGNTAAAPSSGGLFGSSNNQNTNSAPNGGLFGSNNTNTNANTGGLFGQKPAAPAAPGGGLFGSTNTGTGGGLFGGNASNANNTNINTNTGGLFGGSSNTNASGGLFGGGAKPSQGNTGGLFGASNNASGGLFGGQQQQQQQQQQQPPPQLTSMTRLSDLPPDLKNELQQLDLYIEQQLLIATTLDADLGKHEGLVKLIPYDIEYLHTKISSIKQALRSDEDQLRALKSVNDELTEDISNIMHLIIQLATPGTKLSSSFHLNEFFVKKINKYRELLSSYENVINESVHVTSGLEKSCNESNASIYSVVEVVKNQYSVFMELCEVVAQLHGEVEKLRS
ncbi:nucleoporin p58/p45 [Metschnikowia aff. pulcherrima]|uniref:Nucleoporin p58/p45 n=1 Tax=Metschnikowia aff. pulcherrima TaxID=2163413 RepID=A0A4P6XLL5_9ASCO|nr:nucleoporin p58/p45 [Metschnikowia aff. pulcherrima]